MAQNKILVSFDYYPDEPDPADPTGMSEWEHERLLTALAEMGADNIEIEVVLDPEDEPKVKKEKK